MAAKIVLTHRHIHSEHGPLEYCVDYYLTEPIDGVQDGMVGFEPTPGMTHAEIVAELKQMAVDHANLQTSNALPFTLSDVITWEIVE
jgi:hypothetical protein